MRIFGAVWDEEGNPANGASVRIRSTEQAYPFDVTVSATFDDVCVTHGVSLEVVASRPGWTTRRQFAAFQIPEDNQGEFQFGKAGIWSRAGSWAYFLSDYPEIERVTIANGEYDHSAHARLYDPARMTLEIVFSEPFDEATRQRLARAVRLWPADGATGNAAAIDLAGHTGDDQGDGLNAVLAGKVDFPPAGEAASTRGAIHAGPDGRAHAAWSADGRTLTFAIDETIGAVDKVAAYQVGLVSDGALFRAEDGLALGTDQQGFRGSVVPSGRLLANVFWDQGDSVTMYPAAPRDDARQRWNATHSAIYKFHVRPAASPTPGPAGQS